MGCLQYSSDDFVLIVHPARQAKSQEVRGNKDYEESPWEGGAEALERFLQLPQPEQATRERPVLELAEYKGRFRKTTCTSIGMGMKVLLPVLCRALV